MPKLCSPPHSGHFVKGGRSNILYSLLLPHNLTGI